MNIDKDFTFQTIKLAPDYEGEVIATLISSNRNQEIARAYYTYMVIMTISSHACSEKFNENNFDFMRLT
jgi:hypothetical protein